jgi:hypothetical protein
MIHVLLCTPRQYSTSNSNCPWQSPTTSSRLQRTFCTTKSSGRKLLDRVFITHYLHFGYPLAVAVGMTYTQKFWDIYFNNVQAQFQLVFFVRAQHTQKIGRMKFKKRHADLGTRTKHVFFTWTLTQLYRLGYEWTRVMFGSIGATFFLQSNTCAVY